MDIFLSVGTGLSQQQDAFVTAVEKRLQTIGLHSHTIGRNTFSAEAPLRAVTQLMDRCDGAVVIALERFFFPNGTERRGSDKEKALTATGLPTAWNQIEATMAYGRGLPLLVIVDETLRCDGLLEKGNDWFVQEVAIDPGALNSPQFHGVLESWRERVATRVSVPPKPPADEAKPDPAKMSLGEIVGALKPGQAWAVLVALAGALAGAFALGAKLAG